MKITNLRQLTEANINRQTEVIYHYLLSQSKIQLKAKLICNSIRKNFVRISNSSPESLKY